MRVIRCLLEIRPHLHLRPRFLDRIDPDRVTTMRAAGLPQARALRLVCFSLQRTNQACATFEGRRSFVKTMRLRLGPA